MVGLTACMYTCNVGVCVRPLQTTNHIQTHIIANHGYRRNRISLSLETHLPESQAAGGKVRQVLLPFVLGSDPHLPLFPRADKHTPGSITHTHIRMGWAGDECVTACNTGDELLNWKDTNVCILNKRQSTYMGTLISGGLTVMPNGWVFVLLWPAVLPHTCCEPCGWSKPASQPQTQVCR